MVYKLVSLQLMCPTDECYAPIFSFGLYLRIGPTIDNIPFSRQEDEENVDLSLITSQGGCHSLSQR